MTTLCAGCERPSHTYLCDRPDCGPAFESDLALTPWLDVQLTIERARMGNHAGAGHRMADVNPLGFAPAAARCQDALRNTVTTWARDLLTVPAHVRSTGVLAELLLRHARDIRLHPAAGEVARDFERSRKWALRVINPSEDGMTYGICGADLPDGATCPAYLYGDVNDPDASWVRCRACRAQHPTAERRDTMRRRMEVLYFRAATLARIIPLVLPEPRPVSSDLIRAWHRQGKPIKTQDDPDGYPTYRCGDVITVALTTPRRERVKEGSAA